MARKEGFSRTRRPLEIALGVLLDRVDGQTRLLIARRPDDAVLGGLWELPGGKVEQGETPQQALVRELREELGLEVTVGEALGAVEHDYAHARVRLQAFLCTRLAGGPRDLEVAEHRWVGIDEISDYDFPPANRKLFDELLEKLTNA